MEGECSQVKLGYKWMYGMLRHGMGERINKYINKQNKTKINQ